jgi:DNA polymerase-3 subunit gamma/tau
LPVEDLVARLGDLEKRLGGAPPFPPRGNPSPSGGGSSPRRDPVERRDAQAFAAPMPQPAPQAITQQSRAIAPQQTAPQHHASTSNDMSMMGSLALASSPMPTRSPDASLETRRKPAPREVELPTPMPAPTPRAVPEAHASDTVFAEWRKILSRLHASRPDLEAIFAHAVPLEMTRTRVKILYDKENFLAYPASDSEDFELLTRAVRAHFDAPTEVALDLANRPSASATLASVDAKAEKDRIAAAKQEVARHPLIAEAIDIFSGELREVRLPEPRDS